MGVLLLLGAAFFADKTGRPIVFAFVFTIFIALVSSFGNPPAGLATFVFITFIYTSLYFSLLVRVSDNLVHWWLTLVFGTVSWFLIPAFIAATTQS